MYNKAGRGKPRLLIENTQSNFILQSFMVSIRERYFNRLLYDREEDRREDTAVFLYIDGREIMNYTYLVRCADGTFYTGWTNNLEKRMKTHNEGKGAKYTRGKRPVELVYYEGYKTREEAMKREYEIKQLSRQEKEKLIKED